MKLFNGKIVYVFIAVTLFFVLLASITVKLIDSKIQIFYSQTLEKLSREKSLLVIKELESIDRSLIVLAKTIEERQFQTADELLLSEQLYDFIAGYSYVSETGISYEFYKNNETKNQLKRIKKSDYLKLGEEIFTCRSIALEKGSVKFFIALKQLNSHFWNESLGSYAYIEIYDHNGVYVIHPDLERIGHRNPQDDFRFETKIDTITSSDYLGVQVFRQSFPLAGLFKDYKLVVSVPVMITENDAGEISKLILVLWGIGVISVLTLLFFIVRQSQKQHLLQMKNLQYQNEKSSFELSNLKQKVNPHFLFNTLGTLQQLVLKDPVLAKKFVAKLAKVYRKILTVPESGVSTLQDELDFLKEYYFLLQLRFGDALKPITFQIDNALLSNKLPTLSLQLLVENAIKHNELTTENPLSIHISGNDKGIIVENSKCLRKGLVDSEGYGTQILEKIYNYYKIEGYLVEEDELVYKVYLPFIV